VKVQIVIPFVVMASCRALAAPAGVVDFARDIQPILAERCYDCHGEKKQKSSLRLDRKADAFRGGDLGKALIVAGNSQASDLFVRVRSDNSEEWMPPKGPRLTAAQVALLKKWIDAGAPWPEEGGANKQHWAFVAPQRALLPRVRNEKWIRNPIDHFILARLERQGTKPSPEADRVTLIRRLSFDLLGLPPQPEEVREFVNDSRPDAYEQMVDRLLASPHYGEHWGRHWLDLARYADSDGYEKDGVRPYAWLYRDWVIDAMNRDMPFDQFTIEQLAGDLLPEATKAQKVATGFHRQTLTNKEGGVDQEEFRCKAVVDRVSTTSAVWLGLTLGCAECHSHKYDPISQHEFYQFYAFFNNASERDLPMAPADELASYEEQKKAWQSEKAALEAALKEFAGDTNNAAWTNLNAKLTKHVKKQPKLPGPLAAVLAEEEKARDTRIHIRGDFLRKGEPVHPATLAVLHPFRPRAERPDRLDLARWLVDPANPLTSRVTVSRVWLHLFGRALAPSVDDFGTRGDKPSHPELLDWLAVAFATPAPITNDESRITHPGLGWSQKALLKLIVTSATYRQSSRFRPDLAERDPSNILLARQNRFRLEAENVRDAYLAVSGLLNSKIGGPSVRPPLPADIAAVGYAGEVKWKESDGADKYRRGLYIFFQRTVPYPMLTTFDAPDSNVTCTRRERSNTPLQALTLLNDPVFFECAQALGRTMDASEGADPKQRLKRGFELCLSRPPTKQELARLEKLYGDSLRIMKANHENAAKVAGEAKATDPNVAERAALVVAARALLNLDEFVTRD
jgi:hypothetical protein